MSSTVDLHLHSIFSDGSDSAGELIEQLQARGIRTFALTDHDTTAGIRPVEQKVPKEMTFLRGIEFSCWDVKGLCHIIGLNMDLEDPMFRAAVMEGSVKRMQKMEKRIRFLQEEKGVSFTDQELEYLRSLNSGGKAHLVTLLIRKGLAVSWDDAVTNFIDPCPTHEVWIRAEEAIRVIEGAGGVSVLAHPLTGDGTLHLTPEEFRQQLALLKEYGLRAMECYYNSFDRNEVEFLLSEARKNDLLISGGSDYHGSHKNNRIGELNAFGKTVEESDLTVLEAVGIR
ncbi:MAG: PHP domain-containing protein [Anaerovoracaceae bacterium]|jgi:predicted metal-dependent phosphoesterase TrpH